MRFAHNAVAEVWIKPSRIPRKYQPVVTFLRDAAVAAAFVTLVLLAMFAYTGLWPPLVVVESNSMMHGDDNHSNIGTIDTGDLVLVKKVNSLSDIETYMDGQVSGHKTYGDYGDVVIYKRGGLDAITPIIHRALIYLEINSDGTSYRSESLRQAATDKWSTSDPTDTWDRLTSSLTISNVRIQPSLGHDRHSESRVQPQKRIHNERGSQPRNGSDVRCLRAGRLRVGRGQSQRRDPMVRTAEALVHGIVGQPFPGQQRP